LVIKTLDSDPRIKKNAGSGSGSALNHCGSATLPDGFYIFGFLVVTKTEVKVLAWFYENLC
jgi:hypothetical protein